MIKEFYYTMQTYLPMLLAMLLCIIGSAYFSATETAFSSLNKTRLKAMAEKGNRKAALSLRLGEQYDKLISTILIGNNLVNIASASIGTVLFVDLLGSSIGPTVSTVVITIVVLIFGEITPKSVAKDMPERFSMFSAPLLKGLIWLLTPLNFIFSAWKRFVAKVLRLESDNVMSQEELLLLLDEVEQGGAINQDEGELMRNIVEFGDMEAQDILTHRTDLEGVPVDATKEEIADTFTQSRYSRLLVYEESMDHIIGILHQKDFYAGSGVTTAPITDIMAKPIFIGPTEKLNDLLQLLQKRKAHVAVVIDEYGGTQGIVTMEDILEELVGEIWDEHDEVVEQIRQTGEHSYIVDGLTSMDDFSAQFDLDCQSDSVSLGGWVMEQLGRVPAPGDSFTYETLTVTVLSLDVHRVDTVRVDVSEPVQQS